MKPTGNKKYKKIRMPGVNPHVRTKYDVQMEKMLKAEEESNKDTFERFDEQIEVKDKIKDHETSKFKYE
tara:strand:+ start:56 stop:262 length:207 start_codon:yes stop_codon:yes gene_type:complete